MAAKNKPLHVDFPFKTFVFERLGKIGLSDASYACAILYGRNYPALRDSHTILAFVKGFLGARQLTVRPYDELLFAYAVALQLNDTGRK